MVHRVEFIAWTESEYSSDDSEAYNPSVIMDKALKKCAQDNKSVLQRTMSPSDKCTLAPTPSPLTLAVDMDSPSLNEPQPDLGMSPQHSDMATPSLPAHTQMTTKEAKVDGEMECSSSVLDMNRCVVCDYCTLDRAEFSRHKCDIDKCDIDKCATDNFVIDTNRKDITNDTFTSAHNHFECSLCDYQTRSQRKLRKHQQKQHDSG